MEITKEYVRSRMADFLRVPPERLADEIPLAQLIADSFVVVEMLVDLQEQFDVQLRQEDLAGIGTVGDLVALLQLRSAAPADPAPAG